MFLLSIIFRLFKKARMQGARRFDKLTATGKMPVL